MTDRARLTLVDVVFLGASIAVLSALVPPLYDLLNQQASQLGTGELYLFQLVVPGIVLTLLVVMLATAATGGSA